MNKIDEMGQAMLDSTSMGFTMKKAGRLILKKVDMYKKAHQGRVHIDVMFDRGMKVGDGFFEPRADGRHRLIMGIWPYSISDNTTILTNRDILKLDMTAEHELIHHTQYMYDDRLKDDIICEISKCHNIRYYRNNWSRMPHEIDAEFRSTMITIDDMRETYPKIIDERIHMTEGEAMVLARLTERARNGNYILDPPKEPFSSKMQVRLLFRIAEKNRPNERKGLPLEFLHSNDEVAQMLVDENKIVRPEYIPIYQQLAHEPSGKMMDKKMAALVLHLHPELYERYPQVGPKEMKSSVLFGIDMPETKDEVWNRIVPCNETDIFACSVETLSQEESYEQFGYDMAKKLDGMMNQESSLRL